MGKGMQGDQLDAVRNCAKVLVLMEKGKCLQRISRNK